MHQEPESLPVETPPKRRRCQVRSKVPAEGQCTVCCEDFDTQAHERVVCPRCPYAACSSCHQRYLLSSIATPHCLNCKHRWTYSVLLNLFRPTFVNVTYRKQRGQYLLDRAKSHLPLAMPYVAVEKALMQCKTEWKALKKEIDELRAALRQPTVDLVLHNRYLRLDDDLNRLRQRQADLWSRSFWTQHRRSQRVQSHYTFEEPCPVDQCRGLVEKRTHRCGSCKVFVCHKCTAVLGSVEAVEAAAVDLRVEEKTRLDDDATEAALSVQDKLALQQLKKNHTCRQEDIDSVKEIRKESRPCPSCHARIVRISGCDTMWCTQCNTGFNWRTGLVITDTRDLHNPHYVEFLRQNPNFVYPRQQAAANTAAAAAGANPCDRVTLETVALPRLHSLTPKLMHLSGAHQRLGTEILRLVGHIRYEAQRKFVHGNQYNEVEYALRYLVHKWDEKRWRIQVEHHDRFRQTNQEYIDVILTWLVVMNDLVTPWMVSTRVSTETFQEWLQQVHSVTTYTYNVLQAMNDLYRRKTEVTVQLKTILGLWPPQRRNLVQIT